MSNRSVPAADCYSNDQPHLRLLVVHGGELASSARVAALRSSRCFGGLVECFSVAEAAQLAAAIQPELVLLDLDGLGLGPSAAVAAVRVAASAARTVILARGESDAAVLEAVEAGAAGVLDPAITTHALIRTLIGVATGEAALSRRCATRLVQRAREKVPRRIGMRPVRSPLTPREWEVLDLMAGGSTDQVIAARLGVTIGTVRTHVRQLSRKLRFEAT